VSPASVPIPAKRPWAVVRQALCRRRGRGDDTYPTASGTYTGDATQTTAGLQTFATIRSAGYGEVLRGVSFTRHR
jgi:hypothetical protein